MEPTDKEVEKFTEKVFAADTSIPALDRLRALMEKMELTPEEEHTLLTRIANMAALKNYVDKDREALLRARDARRLEIMTASPGKIEMVGIPAPGKIEVVGARADLPKASKAARKLLRGRQ